MDVARIDDDDFRDLIAGRCADLLRASRYLADRPEVTATPSRPLVGRLHSEAAQLEELLDAYGAKRNRKWIVLRSLTAAIKQFADVSYVILHIQHVLPSYRLLPIDCDFAASCRDAMAFTGGVLHRAASRVLDQADALGLPVPPAGEQDHRFAEHLPAGRLADNMEALDPPEAAEGVSGVVTRVATAFLNLASECQVVHVAGRTPAQQYRACIPDPVSEMSLGQLAFRFHSLQALYDTHVTNTRVERLDADLPVLRGHISVVFHLLEIAAGLIHYYERHVATPDGASGASGEPLVDADNLLEALMQYAIAYASRYIGVARALCQTMLKRYAEVGQIVVSAPRYRGFHVRPSTLVAKIVAHYGSEVRMAIDGEVYDAGAPLEIFRANEKINARKRKWLAEHISSCPILHESDCGGDIQALTRRIIEALSQQGHVILYEQPLEMAETVGDGDGNPTLQKVVDQVARLQALGKIDIHTELQIRFTGDKRVLADIALLAESGYGEDVFGNNVPLPSQIAYLRR